MIYSPNSTLDAQMLRHSRELVRDALALLRSSDHLVSLQRLRDELEQERRRPPRRSNERAGPDTELQAHN
ncbi:hypothetical protein [Bradyrhizobium sp. 1(2017)]|jgi:hypothetical protein|uniref:hypothetical protein n=1 Tax=Bradyrhizobium sp. 1(2017) TaxID=1404888 RepID=UPI00140E9799|nr:hypothetical protein [Bradyrhizobium sp. 1(2017)]QIO33422.1 hypothetical protein HAP40_17190 [Bradyrhizobium sp. 1(2017)]